MPNAGHRSPTNCKGSTGAPAVTVNTIDPNLKFPSTWRSSIGFDRRLPWNMIGTVEAMYTRQVQNFYYSEHRPGEGSDRPRPERPRALRRHRDRTVEPGPACAQARRQPATSSTSPISRRTITRTASPSSSMKRFSNNFEGSVAYTYGHSYDVWDLTSSVAFSNWQFGRSLLRPPRRAGAGAVEVGCAAPLRRQRRVHAPDEDRHLAELDRRVRRSVRVRLRQRHERRQLGVQRPALRSEERPRHDADSLHHSGSGATRSRRPSSRIRSRPSSPATPASTRSAARS